MKDRAEQLAAPVRKSLKDVVVTMLKLRVLLFNFDGAVSCGLSKSRQRYFSMGKALYLPQYFSVNRHPTIILLSGLLLYFI